MKKFISVAICFAMLLFITACSSSENTTKDIDLNAVMTKISSNIELPENDMMTLNSKDKLLDYYGINADDVESFAVKMNSSGVQQDEIAMIKAKDAAAAAKIKDCLQKRLDSKANQMKNYLPDQYEIIKKCSVAVNGNYVTLFISDKASEMTDIFNSFIK